MKRPAIFFDRDNTLIANDGYLGDPEKVELIDGAADAVARGRRLGFAIVVFSNQSGVARGMFDEGAVASVNRRMGEMLADANSGAIIDRHEYCPFHPEGTVESYKQESDLRKPRAGMILRAAEALELDLGESWVIGDAPRDVEAGRSAGCHTILVKDESLIASPAAMEEISDATADHIVPNLKVALWVIEQEVTGGAPMVGEEARGVAPSTSSRGREVKMLEGTPSRNSVALGPESPAEEGSSSDAKEDAVISAMSSQSPDEIATVAAPIPVLNAIPANVSTGTTPGARLAALRNEKKSEGGNGATASSTGAGAATTTAATGRSRQEILLEQILDELRRRNEGPASDFSFSKLLAGIVQVLSVAFIFIGYMYSTHITSFFLVAIFLQTMTISLLIMGKQK